jgi:hypothetical protein
LNHDSRNLISKFEYHASKFMKHNNDLGQIREGLREVSRRTFGKQHRLEVAAAATAQEPPIWSRRLARSLGIGDNQAAAELASLEALGALQRFPAEHDRRKIFQPVSHPIWGFARELLVTTIRDLAPGDAEESLHLYWQSVLGNPVPEPIPRAED